MLKLNNKLLAIFLSASLVSDLHATEKKVIVHSNSAVAEVKTVCLNGYLFAVVLSVRGVAITQIFKKYNNLNNPAIPVECKSN